MAESEFRLEDHFDGMSIAYIRQALGHDIEYKYSAAWQRVLGQEFKDQWQVVCEQAPHDDDRSRMDFKLDYFDQSEGTISPVVFVELKRPGGAFNVLENQALAVANSAINEYKMNGIYVFTLWGFNFRAWYVSLRRQVLEPLFGSHQRAKKEYYLGLLTHNGYHEFHKTIDFIKTNLPHRQAPTIPSEQAKMEEMLRAGTYYQDDTSVAGGYEGSESQEMIQPWEQQHWSQ